MPLKLKRGNVSVFERQGEDIFNGLDSLVGGSIYLHQAKAVKAIKEELDNPPEGHGDLRNVSLAVLPTGTGKTGVGVLAAYACRAHRVLVITPSETISKQQLTQFKPVCEGNINPLKNDPFLLKRGIITDESEVKVEDWAPLTGKCVLNKSDLKTALDYKYELVVANAHKFGDGSGKGLDISVFPPDHFSLVIVDEAHHYPAATWKNIVDHFKKTKILFLTATPENKGQYILKDKPECYRYPRDEAISDGIIRQTCFHELPPLIDVNEDPKVKRTIEMQQVLESVRETLEQHDRDNPEHAHKAMILATNTTEARDIAEIWNTRIDNGLGECKTFVQNDPIANVQEFEKAQSKTRVLVVIFRLTEGFDCKNVSVAAILRNVQPNSRVYFAQFVGRAVRKLHKDDPIHATVISHAVHKQRPNYEAFLHEKIAEEDPKDLVEDDKDRNDLEELPEVDPDKKGNDLEELPDENA